jgi:hypothetical protein
VIAKAEDVTTVRKEALSEPRVLTRTLSGKQIMELHRMIELALKG